MRAMFMSSQLRLVMRIGLQLLIIVGCVVALRNHVPQDVALGIPAQVSGIAPWQWSVAILTTIGSFIAVAQYDLLAHRAIKTGVSPKHARISGAVGIALGQFLGFGVITGALARWRMLPEITLPTALRLSAFVSLTFVTAWVILAGLLCLILPAPAWTLWPALAACTLMPLITIVLFLFPTFQFGSARVRMPTVSLAWGIFGWALLDTVLAALTLFVLMPVGTVPFATFFPLFMIALGAGLISNTPGGVGPFELVLLTALPFADPAPLLAAILAYRVIYYAIPAAISAVVMLRPFAAQAQAQPPKINAISHATRSETHVVWQNGGEIARAESSMLALWPTGQMLVVFADPISGTARANLSHLTRAAQATYMVPMIYKCGPRLAAAARHANWRILHIADDALLDLACFDINTPSRRRLRRKLRAVEKTGIIIRSEPPLPTQAMARIDREWQRAHGTARGGSMGRFCPRYIENQWVGCAYRDGKPVAFATAHRTDKEWCLDIMRHSADAPDGTMHALVHAAMCAAKSKGVARFNLASTPACPDPSRAFWRWSAWHISAHAKGAGLRQFKSSFGPYWEPRYAAARSWGALGIGLMDVTRAIHRPTPIAPNNTYAPHVLDENYEVASSRVA